LLTEGSPAKPLTAGEFAAALASVAHFETHPFLAVAVSGGPDSLALTILADRWARDKQGGICALTVDHGLRPESSAEIRLLQGWLSVRAIRHEVLAWSGDKPTSGIQEAAREARYRMLARWCRENGCLHLLTAHHREDQIETHLIRRRAHSGPDGLAGMSVIRELADCRLLRPLLNVSRDRLLASLHTECQPFITDPSNCDPVFERSRLRGGDGAAPAAADFRPLIEGIRALGYERAARERTGNVLLARAVTVHPAGFAVIDPAAVLAMSREMAERVLSAVTSTIGGGRYPPRRERVARFREVLVGGAWRGHTLGGCRFVNWRKHILVLRELAAAQEPARLMPGTSISWDRRFRIRLPRAASEPVTVGYLGLAGVAELHRSGRQRLLPRLLLTIMPAVWDEDGLAAVPHLAYRREGVALLPQFVFRPVNPLTQAGFAVV
jgi:tRNA(Ile)-lysidine synthase